MSRYQKGKTNLDFTEARDNEWQWHQLGLQACTSLQTDNHTSTPPLSFLQTGCPSCHWVPAHPDSPRQAHVKQVCVCVSVCLSVGQIELYTHIPVMRQLVDRLRSLNFSLCAVFLIDAQFLVDAAKFASGVLSALSAMVNLEVRCVSVCLFVSLCVSVCLSVCLPVCLSVCLFVSLSLSVCLSLCFSVCERLSVCLSVSLFLSLCLCLSICVCLHPASFLHCQPWVNLEVCSVQECDRTS